MTLEERYASVCATPSSINGLLPVLRQYASRCDSVAEFGVQHGHSTTAFLMAQPDHLLSIDPCYHPELDELTRLAEFSHIDEADRVGRYIIGKTHWAFRYGDHLNTPEHDIPEVDLLLLDSAHHYSHVRAELEHSHPRVRRWVMIHDTLSYGEQGEIQGSVGILLAIHDFLFEHPKWSIKEHLTYSNGLMILERVDAY